MEIIVFGPYFRPKDYIMYFFSLILFLCFFNLKIFSFSYHILFKNCSTVSPWLIPASVNLAWSGISSWVDSKISSNLSVVVLATIRPVIATVLSFDDLFSVMTRKKFLSPIVSSTVLILSRSEINMVLFLEKFSFIT